ncbi:hypothetical protein NKJ06_17265 [Mesorhizobium sp. M0293]|uniref:hypothetical protein n=1 Tax=unclassified Mesorhizobium TaxID=325217 RepID=UPI003335FEC0
MSERVSGRQGLGILEGAAIVLAIAVACLAMARAEPGLRGCSAVPVSRDATQAKATRDAADATDMLLHD